MLAVLVERVDMVVEVCGLLSLTVSASIVDVETDGRSSQWCGGILLSLPYG